MFLIVAGSSSFHLSFFFYYSGFRFVCCILILFLHCSMLFDVVLLFVMDGVF